MSFHRRSIGFVFIEAQELGEPEVQDFGESVFGEHDVLRLEVAVDDARLVCLCKPIGNLGAQPQNLAHLERSAVNKLAERGSAHMLHHEIVSGVLGADLVDGDDVGMIQAGGCPCLTLESLQS